MNADADSLLYTYFIALGLFLLFCIFIISFIVLYKKKQTQLLLENKLKETQNQNIILQSQLEKASALQAERERIANDMHDDLGSKLSSIKLTSTLLQKKFNDAHTINELNQIVILVTSLTASMREMVWTLNPRNDNTITFANYISAYAKKIFEPSDVHISIHNLLNNKEMILSGFIRRNLLLTIQELLNNIIKHSKASQVVLVFSIVDGRLIIEIKDNGIGMAQNTILGNGTYSIQKRMKECNGIIRSYNIKNGYETTIEIQL